MMDNCRSRPNNEATKLCYVCVIFDSDWLFIV